MFRDNLKDVIEYKGIVRKELAAQTGISKRTIDTYLDNRAVIPNAEVAVKLAKALGTTVEFLVTGEDAFNPEQRLYSDFDTYRKYKKIVNDLDKLPPELLKSIETMIHSAVESSKKK
jgi:transcriptional regulator with XRE-family HTH domain